MKVIVNIVQFYKGEVYSIDSKYHKFSKVIKCKNGFSEIKLSENDEISSVAKIENIEED